ncbi:hypothetical protein EV646_110249 [Kribbella antiqua]|uniref:Uncharacterized protein n=1 Tax=Kribbella antiqua TaxID=2512217 RepID=A0A4R2IP90_9ACTN|nr:DUF5994 family protein [Kribbella antiqua]TCO44535.1 hypothetical protein EV646_110249 [Kribbella antiqua]
MTITANDGRTVMSTTEPSTPRLRLQPGAAAELLDGAWWPRSTDPVAELPGLVLALDAVHGAITRLMLHGNDGTAIRVDWPWMDDLCGWATSPASPPVC